MAVIKRTSKTICKKSIIVKNSNEVASKLKEIQKFFNKKGKN